MTRFAALIMDHKMNFLSVCCLNARVGTALRNPLTDDSIAREHKSRMMALVN